MAELNRKMTSSHKRIKLKTICRTTITKKKTETYQGRVSPTKDIKTEPQ